jgi:cytochrome c oxidase subunit 4
MSDHSHHDVSKHIKGYLIVGGALMIGTLLTVWVSFIDLGHVGNIILALIIATVKASLVALYFMHLISEKTAIYSVLAATAFFFVGLVFLTIWSLHDFPGTTAIPTAVY